MMLTYKDRAGFRISQIRWKRLFAKPTYTRVATTVRPRFTVITTWVGVSSSVERQLALFLTEVILPSDGSVPGDLPAVLLRDQWSATEQDALKAHEERVLSLTAILEA